MTSGSGSGSTDQQASSNNKPLRSEYVPPAIRSAPAARSCTPEEIQQLKALPYRAYLSTPWWRQRRNAALRIAGYACQRCGVKRELEVHHTSYQRLGEEIDTDLEVVCRGCHVGHHTNETQESVGIYSRIISAVITEGKFEEVSDIIEEAKCRCAAANIAVHQERFNAAVSRLIPRFPFKPAPERAELYHVGTPSEPLTRAEAAAILSKVGAAFLIKHMPQVRPLTEREIEKRRALEIAAQAILYQVQRCEEVEREEPK